jgi:adenosylhomocysteinase
MSNVKDTSLAKKGASEIAWARANMPVLAEIRPRFESEKPLAGLTISVALHMEEKTCVLLETLAAGGARVFASSCNPMSTNDAAAAADDEVARLLLASKGIKPEEPTEEQKKYAESFEEGT